jgi:hypothetical protein
MNWSAIWTWISTFVAAHQVALTLIFSNLVGSLPAPGVNSSQFYQFLFKFLNTLPNLSRAYSPHLPIAKAQKQGLDAAQSAVNPRPLAPPAPPNAPK